MAISHKDHDHPNTPAARAACRKAMSARPDYSPAVTTAVENHQANKKAAPMTVVPRKRGDGGVVKGMQATAPKAATTRLKVSGWKLKSIGDLADVPAALAIGVRKSWTLGWDVVVGHPFNSDERRVVVHGPLAEIAMVWDSNDRTAFFVRNWVSSVTFRVDDMEEAFVIAASPNRWTTAGNLCKIGKPVK